MSTPAEPSESAIASSVHETVDVKDLHARLTVVDGVEYCNWDREIFEQLVAGGVSAVHATIGVP